MFFTWVPILTLTRLEKLLLFNVLELAPNADRWASECRAALYANIRDKAYRRRCLGAVFRRAAKADPGWFLAICAAAPGEVMAAAHWITPAGPPAIALDMAALGLAKPGVVVLGPGERGWGAWVADVSEANSMAAATPKPKAARLSPHAQPAGQGGKW